MLTDAKPDMQTADFLTQKYSNLKSPSQPYFIKIDDYNGTFWISGTIIPFPVKIGFVVATISIILLFVFTVTFIAIKHVLHPVKVLIEGTNAVARGDLETQLPVKRHDEFGRLSDSFNKLVTPIKKMMIQKKQLLYDVSHELRSPLTRTKIALAMLPESDKKVDIEEDIKELEIMIDELLETARLEQVDFKLTYDKVDLKQILQNYEELYRTVSCGITFKCLSDSVTISCNSNLLKKALRNIIENALKYSSVQSKQVMVTCRTDDNKVIIKVRDFGSGIDEKSIPHLFEPFYRSDLSRIRDTGGYGLGLFICKRIIESHNGEIMMESKLNEGTTVSIIIPVTPQS